MFATWGDLLGNTTTTFTNPFPFINPPCHPSTQWLQDKHMFNDLRECKECFPAVYWQDPARCSNGFHRSPIMLFPGFAFATMLFSNLMWIHASSQFARVVKGVDLRSTAGNCAWVRTPQLTFKIDLHGTGRRHGSTWSFKGPIILLASLPAHLWKYVTVIVFPKS